MGELREILRRHPGECRGLIRLKLPEAVEAVLAMADSWRIQPSEALNREVNGLLGYPAVETLCGEINVPDNGNGNGRRRTFRGKP
jgi:hypothetical protein